MCISYKSIERHQKLNFHFSKFSISYSKHSLLITSLPILSLYRCPSLFCNMIYMDIHVFFITGGFMKGISFYGRASNCIVGSFCVQILPPVCPCVRQLITMFNSGLTKTG